MLPLASNKKVSPGHAMLLGAKFEVKFAVGVGPASTVIDIVLLSITQSTPFLVEITFLRNSVVVNKLGG